MQFQLRMDTKAKQTVRKGLGFIRQGHPRPMAKGCPSCWEISGGSEKAL
ncbi:hypothetical protein RDABS01_005265 [Bienertia sinuspersici]